jgi:hypothetical protein
VWVPSGYEREFQKDTCYQITYYNSPFLRVEGRQIAYVTRIGLSQECQ